MRRKPGRRIAVAVALAAAGTAGAVAAGAPVARAGGNPVAGCDVDGDGFADLVVGVPGEDQPGARNAGAVQVFRGTAGGVALAGSDFLHEGKPGVNGDPEPGERFGTAVACGDFDGDGFDDLAVGAPGHDTYRPDSGAVHFFPGSAQDFGSAGDGILDLDGPGFGLWPSPAGRLGTAVATGFRTGAWPYDGLVMGAPGDRQGRGATTLRDGSDRGLRHTNDWEDEVRAQDEPGITGTGERDGAAGPDRFGAALAVGDFDGDGDDELAVGVPGESVDATGADDGSAPGEGVVQVFENPSGSVWSDADQWISQADLTGGGGPEPGDRFGTALAAGDFDGDGRDDLAIGVPGEDRPGTPDTGVVHVVEGSAAGLSTAGVEWFAAQSGLTGGTLGGGDDEEGQRFGAALAAGDFDGDGRDDLAIGVPGEDYREWVDAGQVDVLRGTAGGLDDVVRTFKRAGFAPEGSPGDGDRFGAALAVLDVDHDHRADLAIGAPDDDVHGAGNAGAVNVVFGSATGLRLAGDQLLHADRPGVAGSSERGDRFGYSLG